ncbi:MULTISPECIES: acetoin utilization AcuB family protein [Bacillus]|uniref:acetoin utilization AcuB family protein n=1 Tax=Bacillus TaxID=1386 RepID=UPI0002D2AC1B|nr:MULTISPECIES: acetoin utilization AcuB family protein [Bacillus]
MLVEDIMCRKIVSLTERDTIQTAIEIMRKHKIRHVPIVDDTNHLIGLVSNQDIRDATPSIFHSNDQVDIFQKPLSTIMQKDVLTGHPLDFFEDLVSVFYDNKIDCLPILQDGILKGIITETDLLYTFVELTGANQPGSHIQIKVPNKTGILYEISTIFKEKRVNVHSILVYPNKNNEQEKILVIRIQTMNPLAVVSELRKHGYEVLWPKGLEFPS